MKVAIITHTPFPEGLAPSNRVFYHAKGLQKNCVDVKVYIAMLTERIGDVRNPIAKGVYKGVDYEYSLGRTTRSTSFWQRRLDDFLSPIKAGLKVVKDKPDAAVLISHSSPYVLFALKLIFLIKRIVFIVEDTEVALFGKKDHGIYKIRNKILLSLLYKKLDGMLVISYELLKRFRTLVSKGCPIELIPVMIDVEDIYKSDVKRTRDIVYTGPLEQKKDGILTIIESFSNIADQFPETRLICTGKLDLSVDKLKVIEAIEKSGVKERIMMKGFIKREEMIETLNSAVCLVLAKPTSDQANTCFPTKLGEYLATGNPILVTRTGETPLYLKDKESAFIAEPDSVNDFTNRLKGLLIDSKKSEEIGLKGKEVALNSFNYIEITKKVIKLINQIKK